MTIPTTGGCNIATLTTSAVGHGFRLPDNSWLPILHDISITIPSGSHVSIAGPSGSGKSTFLNLLGMLDLPSEGEYLINDTNVRSLSRKRLARLRGETFGFVFQQFNLLPMRTAVENVAAPLLYSRGRDFWRRKELAAEALEHVGLGDRLLATPEQLSGGEQQRVAIARALVRRPSVILADEPTGALDVETGLTIVGLLEEILQERGATLVMITHDVNLAARAPLQLRMDHGSLTQVAGEDILWSDFDQPHSAPDVSMRGADDKHLDGDAESEVTAP